MKYVIIGSALTGNKGAASMLEASIDTISHQDPDATFTLLSMYPTEDKNANQYANLTVLDAKPLTLGLILNPLSVLYKLGLPFRALLRKNKQVKAVAECDVFLDQGGVTFVDGREKFLIYNIASILPALVIGRPVVKCSQALGTFKNPINRMLAKAFLPKVAKIFCRGSKTYSYVQDISPDNSQLAADYAFSLELTPDSISTGETMFKKHTIGEAKYHVGIFPSQVLRNKVSDYDATLASFINKLLADQPDVGVYLLAHSQRPSLDQLHNNDNPACEAIHDLVTDNTRVAIVRDDLRPKEMRAFIKMLDFTIAGRFHAMVSSLAVGVPTLVTTWSHKYGEVLDMFDCPESAYTGTELTQASLTETFEKLWADRSEIQLKIDDSIEAVKQSSASQAREIVEIANNS